MKKIGAFVGKFVPPHEGHVNQIKWCLNYCNELKVVVSDNEDYTRKLCSQSGLPYMSWQLRMAWLKDYFKDEPRISVHYLSENELPPFPHNMKEYSERFFDKIGMEVNVKFGDKTYRELNKKYFPHCEFVEFERQWNLSATLIRSDVKKYGHFIIPQAKSFFEKLDQTN